MHTFPHEAKSIFDVDKKLLFLFLCLSTATVLFVKIALIENETSAFEFLQDRPEGAILRLINALKFFSIPLVYAWKFTVIAFVLWVGCFLFGYRVTYAQCWSIVMVTEFIFLFAEVLKIFWFMVIVPDPTYADIRAFYPFSLMNLFEYEGIEKKWAYPLRALNLFEIAYWFLLMYSISRYTKKDKRKAWIIVSCSYILLFFFWLGFYVLVYK